MSYDHHSAPTNSAGINYDPISPARETRARNLLHDRAYQRSLGDIYADFFQWRHIAEDVIHYRTFDSLPQDEQDAVRLRRRDAYKDSAVPWIVADAGALLSSLDDLDDLGKTIDFVKALTGGATRLASKAVAKLRSDPPDKAIDAWRDACGAPAAPRERKRVMLSHGLNDLLALLGLQALKALFPEWGLIALGLQAAQTLDGFFGIGMQLGPLIGLAEETIFRGLNYVGLPFGPDNNKYHQILAARTTQRINRTLGASRATHPEDVLTTFVGGFVASKSDVLPRLVINPEDYPNIADTITHPWQWPETGFNMAKIAASIPYNLAAVAINDFLAPMLANWSNALTGNNTGQTPGGGPDNEARALLGLTDQGICPGPMCQAELYQNVGLLLNANHRIDPTNGRPVSILHQAYELGMDISQALRALLGA